jgi:hypothetical protein
MCSGSSTQALATAINQRIDQRPQLQTETAAALVQARQRLQRLIDAIEKRCARIDSRSGNRRAPG